MSASVDSERRNKNRRCLNTCMERRRSLHNESDLTTAAAASSKYRGMATRASTCNAIGDTYPGGSSSDRCRDCHLSCLYPQRSGYQAWRVEKETKRGAGLPAAAVNRKALLQLEESEIDLDRMMFKVSAALWLRSSKRGLPRKHSVVGGNLCVWSRSCWNRESPQIPRCAQAGTSSASLQELNPSKVWGRRRPSSWSFKPSCN